MILVCMIWQVGLPNGARIGLSALITRLARRRTHKDPWKDSTRWSEAGHGLMDPIALQSFSATGFVPVSIAPIWDSAVFRTWSSEDEVVQGALYRQNHHLTFFACQYERIVLAQRQSPIVGSALEAFLQFAC